MDYINLKSKIIDTVTKNCSEVGIELSKNLVQLNLYQIYRN